MNPGRSPKVIFMFFLKQSIRGLARNGLMSATSIFILVSCLVIMGCFLLFMRNVDLNIRSIDDYNKVVVFVDDSLDEEGLAGFEASLRNLANVRDVVFVSKEEALERLRGMFEGDLAKIVAGIQSGENKIRNSFEIDYRNPGDVDTMIYQIFAIPGYVKHKNNAEYAARVDDIKGKVSMVMMWLLALQFAVSVFIIINTVKLSVMSRKNEINAMSYIGATQRFIIAPFLLEGVIIGLISAAAAYFIQWYVYVSAAGGIARGGDDMIIMAPFEGERAFILTVFIAVGVLSGLLGSALSARRYIKV